MLRWKMVPREPLPGTAMVRAGKEGTRAGLTQQSAVLCRGKHQSSKSWATSLWQENCETRGGQARLCRTQAAWGCVSAHSERELRKETSKPDLPVLAKKKPQPMQKVNKCHHQWKRSCSHLLHTGSGEWRGAAQPGCWCFGERSWCRHGDAPWLRGPQLSPSTPGLALSLVLLAITPLLFSQATPRL